MYEMEIEYTWDLISAHRRISRSAHIKTNKMACASSEDSYQPGYPPSQISLRCPHEESLGP